MGGGHPEAPPPGGGATSPPRSRPRPCLQRREGQRPAGPWRAGASRRRHVTGRRPRPGVWLRHGGAALRRAPGTATRGPRAGVGPQSGDRRLSRCRPQRSSVPRRAVAQKIRFCPEAQPAQPWASYGSAADEGQRETLTPRHRSHVRVGRLLPTSKRPWDAGARPPLHCPRGEKRGPGGSRRLPQSEAAPGWGRGCCRPHVGKAPGPAAAAGFWPESPPAPGTSPLECLWGLAQLKVPKSFAKQLPGV